MAGSRKNDRAGAPTRSSRRPSKTRVRVAHRSAGRPVSRGIQWDRLPGNWMVVIVLAMALLYIPPVNSYIQQRKATTEQKAQLQELGRENRELKQRARALRRNSTIELEARGLGMVRPDERPYVILR
jgi:hypothetical protein